MLNTKDFCTVSLTLKAEMKDRLVHIVNMNQANFRDGVQPFAV